MFLGAALAIRAAVDRGCRIQPYECWHNRTESVQPVYRVPAGRTPNEDGATRSGAMRYKHFDGSWRDYPMPPIERPRPWFTFKWSD